MVAAVVKVEMVMEVVMEIMRPCAPQSLAHRVVANTSKGENWQTSKVSVETFRVWSRPTKLLGLNIAE